MLFHTFDLNQSLGGFIKRGSDLVFDTINFVAFSTHLQNLVGQVFALFVLTVAAAEAAIGLAILVVYYRNRGSIAVEDINMMKG